jgi:hypothetical protein
MGPYVALRQKAVNGPASYAVLLYPVSDAGPGPVLESLGPVEPKVGPVGFRVRRGGDDDLLVVAPLAASRRLGAGAESIATDAEMACVRRRDGRLLETALVNGRRLEVGGTTLIETGPEVLAAHVRYVADRAEVSTRGRGMVRIAKTSATQVTVNGAALPLSAKGDRFEFLVGRPGTIQLTAPVFATDPLLRCKGIGVPRGYGGVYQGPPQSALVRLQSSVPSDFALAWRGPGEPGWKHVLNPEPTSDHYYLLTDLEDGKTYQLRIACRNADGRAGLLDKEFTYKDPDKAAKR